MKSLKLRYREKFLLLAVESNPNVFQDYKKPKILKKLQDLDLVRDQGNDGIAQKYTASGAAIRNQILNAEI